ncbi:SPW repeat domain-containing protein [Neorhizobium sp. NPDC001467]|uniref:SPW repeat domain-containing protein n=1 Tax=Neorhizobium sp. NPDC001467 TaxID=3390595 RepID=UPI003D006D14
MRIIPTRLHGILDYLVGLILIALPIALPLQGAAFMTLICLGLFAILYSLFTDYELGVIRFLRIRFHLALDVLFGLVMLAASRIVDFPPAIHWLVPAIGILAIILAFITQVRATGTAP